ncbi:MAG: aspartate kinase [Spirochaetaceae bacterium]|jgi:aspartokinase/homoserine dehydrogenase 1|nr:aspartate kinase [Spirochaetaceae bacterium]
MMVLKFGGTSVGSPGAIERVIGILKDSAHAGRAGVVVVSAFSGVTDALIEAGRTAAQGRDYAAKLSALEKRHVECVRHFLSGAEGEAAVREIGRAFQKLELLLHSVLILKELSARTLDCVMGFGERLCAELLARVFSAKGVPADYLDSRLVIRTDEQFGKAKVLQEETARLIKGHFAGRTRLQIAAGFIGSTADGAAATLGRGGSDLSAAIYGAALGVEEIEIWTDVDGIMTADPKLVKNAFTIERLSYAEAMELSHFGAKVLHAPTVQPALDANIPIRIRNVFRPEGTGTLISSQRDVQGEREAQHEHEAQCAREVQHEHEAQQGREVQHEHEVQHEREVQHEHDVLPVKGISSIGDITLVLVQGTGMVGVAGFSARLFSALSRENISVILYTQASSEYSICFAVMPEDGGRAAAAVNAEFEREIATGSLDLPLVERDKAVIAVVGSKMESTAGISGKVFYALGRNGVNVDAIAQGSSEINISLVVAAKDVSKALNSVHEAFFLSGTRSVNLFLVGLGLIGGTLLDQIARQREVLAEKYKIHINIAGLANSKKMLFAPPQAGSALPLVREGRFTTSGINPAEAVQLLEGGAAFNSAEFITLMKAANLPNTAFCDCTASEEVASHYEDILRSSIPVVTPNKKANSGSLDYYKRLTSYSQDRGIPYLYEVTVCAGLPVISTLRDLHLSGDTVRRIEGVFSGTLSFIFNNFDGSKPFSALVREAKAKGYTEPDPRDDLNAMDAARKALILARECGMPLEFADVRIDPILPEACFAAKSVEAFFTELEKSDAGFEQRRAAAAADGKMLRYIAIVEAGSARLSLRAEPEGSPFRSLVDADNIVVITSDRYVKLPMVVKGPGAGAEVTAGAVFSDIVRIARTLV